MLIHHYSWRSLFKIVPLLAWQIIAGQVTKPDPAETCSQCDSYHTEGNVTYQCAHYDPDPDRPDYDGSQYLTGYVGAALAVAGPALGAGIGIAGSAFGETKYMLVSAGCSVPIFLLGLTVAVIIYPQGDTYTWQQAYAALGAGTGLSFAGLAAGLVIAATGALPPGNLGLPCPPLVTRLLVCAVAVFICLIGWVYALIIGTSVHS